MLLILFARQQVSHEKEANSISGAVLIRRAEKLGCVLGTVVLLLVSILAFERDREEQLMKGSPD